MKTRSTLLSYNGSRMKEVGLYSKSDAANDIGVAQGLTVVFHVGDVLKESVRTLSLSQLFAMKQNTCKCYVYFWLTI